MPLNPISDDWLEKFRALDISEKNPKGTPPAKKLSMLVRPAFVTRKGKTFRWGDWSAIEARVLPFLAGTKAADKKLDIFRENDKDPNKPDVYIKTACDLNGHDPEEVWDAFRDPEHPDHDAASKMRQAEGKVPELSLGFGGGLGALQAMAANYGVYFDPAAGKRTVDGWRAANGWAKTFWGSHGRDGSYGLWGAINTAIENPDTICPAGRVAYVYDRSYLGGTVFCALPCGRLLTYPGIKWEWREVEDKKTGKLADRYQLTFIKGYGRSALWYGKCAENVTQAFAASILRRTLKRLKKGVDPDFGPLMQWMPVRMHTHDEIVVQVAEDMAEAADEVLLEIMEHNDDYDAGLPLKAEIGGCWYYTKSI